MPADTIAAVDEVADGQPIVIGRSGALEAVPLARVGDHAMLVRQAGTPRALLTADVAGAEERLVVTPLDADVVVHVDGDALAVWLARGLEPVAPEPVPSWASLIGLVILLTVLALTVIGSLTAFGWLVRAIAG
ncbi:MAG: hypothetical protein ACRDGV_12350 [Candidatus Limnocylindria bacterium]